MKKSILICSMAMTGCQMMPPVKVTTPFNQQSHEVYLSNGTASIKGQAFLKQNGGTVVTCAGNTVYLTPDTKYYQEVFEITKKRRKPEDSDNKELIKKYIRKTQCDAQGNFEFNQLPENNWILATEVTWNVGYSKQGGGLIRNIKTTTNENLNIILSDQYRF